MVGLKKKISKLAGKAYKEYKEYSIKSPERHKKALEKKERELKMHEIEYKIQKKKKQMRQLHPKEAQTFGGITGFGVPIPKVGKKKRRNI